MFTFEELCALIRVVSETRVGGVEVERDGVRYRVDGIPPTPVVQAAAPPATMAVGPALVAPQAAVAAAQASPLPAPAAQPAAAPVASEEEENLTYVTSPIVGTFYRAPNPDAEPYVKVGDTVTKGQVLCIVEAMKLMNEIESDTSGVVVKIYPENAQPVEFGERLFAIRPA